MQPSIGTMEWIQIAFASFVIGVVLGIVLGRRDTRCDTRCDTRSLLQQYMIDIVRLVAELIVKFLSEPTALLILLLTSVSVIATLFGNAGGIPLVEITLFALLTFAIEQILKSRQIHDDLSILKEELAKLTKAEVLDVRAFYARMAQATRRTTRTVDLMQLQEVQPSLSGVPEANYYFSLIAELSQNRNTRVRRIVSIETPSKFLWVLKTIDKSRSKGYKNFNLRYIDISVLKENEDRRIPFPLNIQIFDRREILIVNPKLGYSTVASESENIWIEDSEIARVFSTYYDRYWNMCTSLIEYDETDCDALESIWNKLKGNWQGRLDEKEGSNIVELLEKLKNEPRGRQASQASSSNESEEQKDEKATRNEPEGDSKKEE